MKHNYRSSKKEKGKWKRKKCIKIWSQNSTIKCGDTSKKVFLKKRKMLVLSNFMCHNTLHKGHNMVHKFIYSQTQDSLCCHADYSQQEMHYLLFRLRDWVTNFSYHELFTWPTFKKRKRKKKDQQPSSFLGKNLLNTKITKAKLT